MNRVQQFFPPNLRDNFLLVTFKKDQKMYSNIHENYYNVDDLSDAEFDAVKTKFFEIFGHDKNCFEIEVLATERLEQSVSIHCLFQNNSFVVQLLQ